MGASARWARARRLALERAGWRCEICGAREQLIVHHLDGRGQHGPLAYTQPNLVADAVIAASTPSCGRGRGDRRAGGVAPSDPDLLVRGLALGEEQPAAGVRRFVERFRGEELEVVLEATTGWRFVVEELRRIGAVVRLAEPAETAATEYLTAAGL
jgi:hypothetical protein